MSACLVCTAAVRADHVLCRACFAAHQSTIAEVQADPLGPDVVRKKVWGQRFAKNRTPVNRARVVWAAHMLARAGDGEYLADLREIYLSASAAAQEEPEEAVATEAQEVSLLEEALDRRAKDWISKAGDFKTRDGHFVRSKSEREIADFLYENRIRYAYERRVSIGDTEFWPDFYLPDARGGLYIEHFGFLEDKAYEQRAIRKVALFRKAQLNLIVTDERDARDFNAELRRKLAPWFPHVEGS